MDKDILLTNIQRFSLHDGPGIRTTVFLKGCSVFCPWCCNPENLQMKQQQYLKNGIKGIYGEWYCHQRLLDEILKDQAYYGKKPLEYDQKPLSLKSVNSIYGGVTFSGGECLVQMDALEPVLENLKNKQIHLAIETSLFALKAQVDIAIKYIDLFYIDIKIMDKDKCSSIIKGDLNIYLDNLYTILNSKKPIIFRLPVINGFTDDSQNRKNIIKLISKAESIGNVIKIEILKEHNLGLNKYIALRDGGDRISIPKYLGVSDKLLEMYKREIISQINIPVEICKF